MSHDLAQTKDGAYMMAYQGATPWHSLGAKIEDPTVTSSVDRFLNAANLDWTVDFRSLSYKFKEKSMKVPNRRAIVRETDGQLLSVVGNDYTLVQNSEAFAVLQPACDQFGVTIETAGALGKGDRVWMLAKMPESIEPVPGDKIGGYLLIMTGHNGWTSYSARLTEVRVVCANTIALAQRDKAFCKLRHVKTAGEQLDQVASLIEDMVASFQKSGESFAKLAQRRMTMDEMRVYVNGVLNLGDDPMPVAARRRDNILELATKTGKGIDFAPGTAWAAFNAITEYVDHVRPAEAKNARTIQQANESALFGANAKVKAKALSLARQLVA